MDAPLNKTGRIVLKDVECVHNVIIPDYYGMKHVVVFMDKKANVYAWATASSGSEYMEGNIYNITARCSSTRKLDHVMKLNESTEEVNNRIRFQTRCTGCDAW